MPVYTLARNDGPGAFRAVADSPPRQSRSLWKRLFASGDANRQENTLTTTLGRAVPSLSKDPPSHYWRKDEVLDWKVTLGHDATIVTPDDTFRIPAGQHRRMVFYEGSANAVILYYDGTHLYGGWHVIPTDGTLMPLTQGMGTVGNGVLQYLIPLGRYAWYRLDDLKEKDGRIVYLIDDEDDPESIEERRRDANDTALRNWQTAAVSSEQLAPHSDRLRHKTRPAKPFAQMSHTYDDVHSVESFRKSVQHFINQFTPKVQEYFRFSFTLRNGVLTCVFEITDKRLLGVKKQLTFDAAA